MYYNNNSKRKWFVLVGLSVKFYVCIVINVINGVLLYGYDMDWVVYDVVN